GAFAPFSRVQRCGTNSPPLVPDDSGSRARPARQRNQRTFEMTKRPLFWILLTLGCALSTAFAIYSFPKAFPIISIDLKMNRASALRAASELAGRHGWGPRDQARQAATFGVDDTVRT